MKTLLAFCEVQRVSSCGPHEATTRCLPRSDQALLCAVGCCLWNVATVQAAVVLSENPLDPSLLGVAGWSGPGARAPGGLPHKAAVSLGKSAAAQYTGQCRVVWHQGASPGVFCRYSGRLWVAMGCLWVASPPSPLPVRDKTPPSTDVVIYGFPPPPPSPPGRGAKDPKP